MPVPSQIPQAVAEDHAAFPFDGSSPFDSTLPRKRWAPPGWDVSTTITSHGLKASEIVVVDNWACQNHRQRYPEVEAIVQMFFRVCAVVLNIIVLIIVCVLDTNLANIMPVKRLYGVVGYSLLLNTVELISLGNPQSTLLMHLFPSLFPAIPSTSSLELQPRFPRLPSLCLSIAEFAALATNFHSAIMFLNSAVVDDAHRNGCPVLICVLPQERDAIYGYMLGVIVGLLHVGFFLMASVHYVKKNGPGWLEKLEK